MLLVDIDWQNLKRVEEISFVLLVKLAELRKFIFVLSLVKLHVFNPKIIPLLSLVVVFASSSWRLTGLSFYKYLVKGLVIKLHVHVMIVAAPLNHLQMDRTKSDLTDSILNIKSVSALRWSNYLPICVYWLSWLKVDVCCGIRPVYTWQVFDQLIKLISVLIAKVEVHQPILFPLYSQCKVQFTFNMLYLNYFSMQISVNVITLIIVQRLANP